MMHVDSMDYACWFHGWCFLIKCFYLFSKHHCHHVTWSISKHLWASSSVNQQRTYLDYTRVFSAASKHWRLTDWLFWSLLKHLGMISISFDMFGSCHFFICIFYENHWFFCLYFVLFTFVYNVKFSNWSMTVQMYKTINKKNKTDS